MRGDGQRQRQTSSNDERFSYGSAVSKTRTDIAAATVRPFRIARAHTFVASGACELSKWTHFRRKIILACTHATIRSKRTGVFNMRPLVVYLSASSPSPSANWKT